MKNAVILHGAGNDSQGNWFPWLHSELEKKGYTVWTPNLPNTNTPIQKDWLNTIFSNKEWIFNEDSILIGHSAGATLILRILENLPEGIKIKKAIFVSCPIDKGKFPEFFQYKKGLTEEPFKWDNIKNSCSEFYFIASDNDPYDCGERHAIVMQEKLGGEVIIKQGEGHFNLEKSSRYKEFPLLIKLIE